MELPSSQPVSFPVDLLRNFTNTTTLNTCPGSVTLTVMVVLLGSHEPQWKSVSLRSTESNPVPSRPVTGEVGAAVGGSGVSVGRVTSRNVLVGSGVSVGVADGFPPIKVGVS